MNIIYIIILSLTIICLHLIYRQYGPVNYINNKAYTQPDDSIDTIIERIKWSNHYKGRVNYVCRYFVWSVIITYLVGIICFNDIPKPVTSLQLIIVVWLILNFLDSFFTFHVDKFTSYAIEQNIDKIRMKLKLPTKKQSELSEKKEMPPPYDRCFSFGYN